MIPRDYIEIDLFDEKLKLFQRSTFEVQALDGFIRDNYGLDANLTPFEYAYVNSVVISDSLKPNIEELESKKISWFKLVQKYKLKKKIYLFKNLFNPNLLQKIFSPQKLEELKEMIIFDVEKADKSSVKKKVEIQ